MEDINHCGDCGGQFPLRELLDCVVGKDNEGKINDERLLCEECLRKRPICFCQHCDKEFPADQLFVVDLGSGHKEYLCGGCKQEWEHGFPALLDTLNLSPRKEALNQIFAAKFLLACGWTVEPPQSPEQMNHLSNAEQQWNKWQEHHDVPWKILASDFIRAKDAMKHMRNSS